MCCGCVRVLQRGQTGDGCDLDSTLRKYDLRKGDLLTELGKGATSEAGKYLFRAANVWWRYVQYLVVVVLPQPGPSSSQSRFPLSR